MKFGYRDVCLEHSTGPRHPESPDRLRAIREALSKCHGVEYSAGEPATVATIEGVHDPDYVSELRSFCENGGGQWDADTVATGATWDAALASAGLGQWAVETALDGADGRNTPFSLGRPPGHHAVADDAMGFCFFNNVALAAEAAREAGDVERIAIVDWDVHHGNGTQELFYDRGDVLFASIHEQGLYPGTGAVDETGEAAGAGRTINVPFPPGAGEVEYIAALERVIGPEIRSFDPGLVIVSAGFDAHEHDPISRMRLPTEGYGQLANAVRELASDTDAALAFVLEGGYGLDTLSESVRTVHEVFDGYEPPAAEGEPSRDALSVLEALEAQGFGS
ncbi:MAG: histone deacetylase family protein [Salinirussus sp.]